jgi:hypothetical protein
VHNESASLVLSRPLSLLPFHTCYFLHGCAPHH